MTSCLNCCQAHVIILFCLTAFTVYGGMNARYGAGNSERAMPDYFGKNTQERMENHDFSSHNEVKIRVVALTFNAARQNGVLTVDIISGSFENARRYIGNHLEHLVRKESHSKDATKIPSKSKLMMGYMSKNEIGFYEVRFSISQGIMLEDWHRGKHGPTPVPDPVPDPDNALDDKSKVVSAKESKRDISSDQGESNNGGKRREGDSQPPLRPEDMNSDGGTLPEENVSTQGDDNKTDNSREKDVDKSVSADGNAQTGVRGWCKCDEHDRGVVYYVGEGAHAGNRQIMMGDYRYPLCRRCGRVIRPSESEDNGYCIIDQRIVQEFEKRRAPGMTTSQIAALHEQMGGMLRKANEKLRSLPDGSVIASGLCKCQIPDPIKVGWGITDEDDFYVCNFCGRIREPDSTGSMDLGPTMLREMGLMKHKNEIWKRISQLAETNEVKGK